MAGYKRRDALRVLAAGGAAGLTGCDLFGPRRPAVSKIDPADFPRLDRIRPILKPEITGTPANNFPTLDAHAHFFNASDVNVKDYVGECVGREQRTELGHEFFRLLGEAADKLAKYAPTAKMEFDRLTGMLNNDGVKFQSIDSLPGENYEVMSQQILQAIDNSGFHKVYREQQLKFIQKSGGKQGLLGAKQASQPLTAAEIQRLIDPKLDAMQEKNIFFEGKANQSSAPSGFIAFLAHMMSYRYTNLKTYAKYYSTAPGSFGITGVFGSLVDFDNWLDNDIYSSRRDQMLLHSLLSAMSGGYMLPLISFNPWQSPANASASFELMKEAVCKWGYVGVKVYPPIGYYPYGNSKLLTQPGRYTGDRAKLDKALKDMYDWCAQHDVPVMAHAGKRKGVSELADAYGGPDGYGELLDAYNLGPEPGKLAPTVLAGHFGDADKETGGAWSDAFVRFLDKRNGVGRNFYSDIAYWDEFLDCGNGNAKCKDARERVQHALAQHTLARSHLLYGSDWFMMSQVDGWERYPAAVQAALCPDIIDAKALFHDNVKACFGFRPGSQQTRRIAERLGPTPGGLPGWLLKG